MRARRRPLPDDEVELEVLHRGIEHLLDLARQAVDLVDEEHVAALEVGEDRREVAAALEHGPRRAAACDAHLVRDDVRERRLAEAGRTRRAARGRARRRARARPRSRRRGVSRIDSWPTYSSSARGRSDASNADVVVARPRRDRSSSARARHDAHAAKLRSASRITSSSGHVRRHVGDGALRLGALVAQVDERRHRLAASRALAAARLRPTPAASSAATRARSRQLEDDPLGDLLADARARAPGAARRRPRSRRGARPRACPTGRSARASGPTPFTERSRWKSALLRAVEEPEQLDARPRACA